MANSVEIKADRIDALANELKQKHGEKYSRMQYKLWAEVVDCKKHTSLEEPPLGSIWNKQQKDKNKKEGNMDQMATACTSLANSVSAALQPMHGIQIGMLVALVLHRFLLGGKLTCKENYCIICRFCTPCTSNHNSTIWKTPWLPHAAVGCIGLTMYAWLIAQVLLVTLHTCVCVYSIDGNLHVLATFLISLSLHASF